MKFKNWLENSATQGVGYHKTESVNVESIFNNGFLLNKARKYELGLGIYLATSIFGMKAYSNDSVIECHINNFNLFLDVRKDLSSVNIFTEEEKKIIYEFNWYVPPNTYNSDLIKKIMYNYKGLMTDRIIVCYDAKDVIPIKVLKGNNEV